MSARRKTTAHRRLRSRPFESPGDLGAFFRACDALEGPAREPDWHEHLAVIEASRRKGTSGT